MQVVHFHESNSSGVIYPTHNRGVITRWQVCHNRRFVRVTRSVAAVLNILDLIASDDPSDDRIMPVVIRGNRSPVSIVQFQYWIAHCIWNSVSSEPRANSTQNQPLWLTPLYNESANHHVVARLHKGASAEIR